MYKLILLLFLSVFVFSCGEENNDPINPGPNVENPDDTTGKPGDTTDPSKPSEDSQGAFVKENWFLPYPKPEKYISYGGDWSKQIKEEWAFYKRAMIDEFGIDLACRNNKEAGKYHAFSEGVAYALIFSLYMNDEECFQKVFDAAEKIMRLERGYYGWKYSVTDEKFLSSGDKASATDAEMEIAYALYSAAKLVEKGYWSEHRSTDENNSKEQTYKERADEIMELVLNQDDEDGNTQIQWDIILPGDKKMWFERTTDEDLIIYNPSYFMPAYVRAFADMDNKDEWERVIEKAYRIQNSVENGSRGIGVDWCKPDGSQIKNGYPAQEEQYSMYLDGIRVPFRIGMDAIWYGSSEAREYCNNTAEFIGSWENAGFYSSAGELMKKKDEETDYFQGYLDWMRATFYDYANEDIDDEEMSSTSFASLSMWLIAVLGSDNEDLKVEMAEKLKGTWVEAGLVNATSGTETMPRFGVDPTWSGASNHYFLHSLAMFGALAAAGALPNILDDLK